MVSIPNGRISGTHYFGDHRIGLGAMVEKEISTPPPPNLDRTALPPSRFLIAKVKVKGSAIPIQVFRGQKVEVSRFQDSAHESGKVVSPEHRPPLTPGDNPGTHSC
jgi:hypothetical protein